MKGEGWTDKDRAAVVAYALKQHEANRAIWRQAMGLQSPEARDHRPRWGMAK